MEEKITIIISNYRGQKVTYTMPENAVIHAWSAVIVDGDEAGTISQIGIEVNCSDGIEIEKEDLI